MEQAPDIRAIRKLMIGKWQLDDGRLIEFTDETNLVLTTRLGMKVRDTYRVYKENGEVKLSLPILLSLHCTLDHIDEKILQYTEHGVIGQVVMKRFKV
jgi:hypothetical protein